MAGLKVPILKILGKTYEPLNLIEQRFGRYDMAFRTDEKGQLILLFIWSKDENEKIKGESYAQSLVLGKDRATTKDHWDHKGKATFKI